MTDIQPKQAHELPFDELPTRWEIELEFVQSLANTQYLIYLNQSGYLNDPCFLNYLNYLNYWKLPKYSKFLVYPNCLHILTLLQNEKFRMELNNLNFTNLLYNDMTELWKEPLFKDENELKKKEKVDAEQKNDKIEVNSVPDGGNSNFSVDVISEVIPSQNASPSKPALNDVEMKDI